MKKLLKGTFLFLNLLAALALLGAYFSTHISPNTVGYFYFLGLAYPYILGANVLFVILWLFLKRKFALISGITVLLGFNHLRHFVTLSFGSTTLEAPIKIVSYNVHIFNLYDVENRVKIRDENFEFLTNLKADIYCFQEFYHQKQSSNFETKSILMSKFKMDHVHEGFTHKMTDERHFGLATFTKYPILAKGEIPFENDDNNFCIYSDVLINTDTVRVYNAHLGSIRFQDDDYQMFGDENGPKSYLEKEIGQQILSRLKLAFEKRAIQAEIVSEHISHSPYKSILAMDLNDTPVSYAYRQFGNILDDAFLRSGNGVGNTYIGKMPSNRIDYIFYSPGIQSSNFETHQVEFSDHKPISCEISLN